MSDTRWVLTRGLIASGGPLEPSKSAISGQPEVAKAWYVPWACAKR
jgi:hypothetical protein